MRLYPRPWRRLFPASASPVPLLLLFAGWAIVGIALWTADGIGPYLALERPRIFLEVFIADSATTPQVEEISQQILAQPFSCGTAFVSAEDARLRAARDPRVRRLLEAYGGNPLPRIIRVELCAGSVPECGSAIAWLRSLPHVSGARAPEAFVGGLMAGERLVLRVVRTGALAAGLGGLILAVFGLGLMAREGGPEIAVMERNGAAPGLILSRLFWTMLVPSLTAAMLVLLALRLAGILVALAAPWLEDTGVALAWMRLPAFSPEGAAALLGTAIVSAALLVFFAFAARVLKNPS